MDVESIESSIQRVSRMALLNIIKHLDFASYYAFLQLSKHFYKIANSEQGWTHFLEALIDENVKYRFPAKGIIRTALNIQTAEKLKITHMGTVYWRLYSLPFKMKVNYNSIIYHALRDRGLSCAKLHSVCYLKVLADFQDSACGIYQAEWLIHFTSMDASNFEAKWKIYLQPKDDNTEIAKFVIWQYFSEYKELKRFYQEKVAIRTPAFLVRDISNIRISIKGGNPYWFNGLHLMYCRLVPVVSDNFIDSYTSEFKPIKSNESTNDYCLDFQKLTRAEGEIWELPSVDFQYRYQ